jgi:hypothetical protein
MNSFERDLLKKIEFGKSKTCMDCKHNMVDEHGMCICGRISHIVVVNVDETTFCNGFQSRAK